MSYRLHESAGVVTVAPEEPAHASVIWLHGLGADGHDFAPIVPQLRLPERLAVRFVFPHAPRRAVTINQGMMMRAWYDVRTRGGGLVEDFEGIAESTAMVERLVLREGELGIAPGRTVLAGFSQGGAIALYAGVRSPSRLGGIMGLSTYLPRSDALGAEAGVANRSTPILLCHGHHDTVLPLALGEIARERLRAAGYAVQWQAYPMAHEVCAAEIHDIAAWLARVLGPLESPQGAIAAHPDSD